MSDSTFIDQLAQQSTRWREPVIPAPDNPLWADRFYAASETGRDNVARAWLTYAVKHWTAAKKVTVPTAVERYACQNVDWVREIRPYLDAEFWQESLSDPDAADNDNWPRLHAFFTAVDAPVMDPWDMDKMLSWLVFGSLEQRGLALRESLSTPHRHERQEYFRPVMLDLTQQLVAADATYTPLLWHLTVLCGAQRKQGSPPSTLSPELECWYQLGTYAMRLMHPAALFKEFGLQPLQELQQHVRQLPVEHVAAVFRDCETLGLRNLRRAELHDSSFWVTAPGQTNVFDVLRAWVPQATSTWDAAQALGLHPREACDMVVQASQVSQAAHSVTVSLPDEMNLTSH